MGIWISERRSIFLESELELARAIIKGMLENPNLIVGDAHDFLYKDYWDRHLTYIKE